jgi:hypothetical protein
MFARQVHTVCIYSVISAIRFVEQCCVRGDILFAGPYSKQAIVFVLFFYSFHEHCPQSDESTLQLKVEDPNGDVILVSLYNFPGLFLADLKVLQAHFPIGTVMAIREPWMKMSAASSHPSDFIRVDSPSDIVILEPSHPTLHAIQWKTSPVVYRHTLATALQWKDLGTKFFKDGLFIPAALAWSRGIDNDPSMHTLRLNRSQAYIRLEWFSAALVDATHVLSAVESLPQIEKKASYRAACAEYGLQRYSDALARLKPLEEDREVKSLKSRCHQRLLEATKGQYDWLRMFKDGQASVPRLDVAEFVHSAIAVSAVPNRGGGRGIVATHHIRTGDLLVSLRYHHSTHQLTCILIC